MISRPNPNDERAAAFYQESGFIRLNDKRMLLPMKEVTRGLNNGLSIHFECPFSCAVVGRDGDNASTKRRASSAVSRTTFPGDELFGGLARNGR